MNPAELVNYPLAKKASDIIPVRDGNSIDLGGRRLEVIEIPGHTPGSIAILDVERRILFSGDTVQDGSIFLRPHAQYPRLLPQPEASGGHDRPF